MAKRAVSLDEVMRRGRLGDSWEAIALSMGTDKNQVLAIWGMFATPSDRYARAEARERLAKELAARQAVLAAESRALTPAGGDLFLGAGFADDPRALRDRGSPSMPSRAVRHSGCSSSAAWLR